MQVVKITNREGKPVVAAGSFEDVFACIRKFDPNAVITQSADGKNIAIICSDVYTYEVTDTPYCNIYLDGPEGLRKALGIYEPVAV